MQMNPRPAKSLNQRPAKQLSGSVPNTSNMPVSNPVQPTQNVQAHVSPRTVTPLTKGMSTESTDNKAAFLNFISTSKKHPAPIPPQKRKIAYNYAISLKCS